MIGQFDLPRFKFKLDVLMKFPKTLRKQQLGNITSVILLSPTTTTCRMYRIPLPFHRFLSIPTIVETFTLFLSPPAVDNGSAHQRRCYSCRASRLTQLLRCHIFSIEPELSCPAGDLGMALKNSFQNKKL